MTEFFCVATKFGLDRKFLVMKEYFLVTTEFGARAKRVTSRHSALCRNGGARHCVAATLRRSQVVCVRQTRIVATVWRCVVSRQRMPYTRYRPGRARTIRLTHQGWTHTTEVFYRDRDFSVTTNFV